MPYSAGTAYLQVIPSFIGVEKAFEDLAEKLGT
jgi:myo-inositol-1-phosphate synthase